MKDREQNIQPNRIDAWLKQHGFNHDPFAVTFAEGESNLGRYLINTPSASRGDLYTEVLEEYGNSVVWGESGTGKTVLTKRLISECRPRQRPIGAILPLYLRFEGEAPDYTEKGLNSLIAIELGLEVGFQALYSTSISSSWNNDKLELFKNIAAAANPTLHRIKRRIQHGDGFKALDVYGEPDLNMLIWEPSEESLIGTARRLNFDQERPALSSNPQDMARTLLDNFSEEWNHIFIIAEINNDFPAKNEVINGLKEFSSGVGNSSLKLVLEKGVNLPDRETFRAGTIKWDEKDLVKLLEHRIVAATGNYSSLVAIGDRSLVNCEEKIVESVAKLRTPTPREVIYFAGKVVQTAALSGDIRLNEGHFEKSKEEYTREVKNGS